MSDQNPPPWGEIVECHAERVFRIAFRVLGSVHDAEDVSQIVFTEAFKSHSTGTVTSWTGLLVRLATVRAIDLMRSRRHTVELVEGISFSNIGPTDVAIGAELSDWLRTAVSQLPEQQAAIFSLTYFEQLDRNEIATVLGISADAVSTALYKARQRLTTLIAVHQGENSQ